jgi:hypothetical protein
MRRFRALAGRLLLAACFWAVVSAAGAEPQIKSISPRGIQIGESTLTIAGEDLAANPRLAPLDSNNPFNQTHILLDGGNDRRATFKLTLNPFYQSGIYPLRVINDHGVSSPVLVAIDRLPTRPFSESVESLPVALSGNVAGAGSLRTTFAGKAGQRVVIDVEAQRLGSKLNPSLRLYDGRGNQLAWSRAERAISGDARIDIKLPRDGRYTVELHDAAYRGGGFFRLKIGGFDYADFTLPLAVERGQQATLHLIGSPLAPIEPITVTAPQTPLAAVVDTDKICHFSGERPWYYVSRHPEYVEQESAEKVQTLPAAPVGVSGRILKPRETDVYQLPVTPGAKLRFEVIAYRVGSGLDAVLTLRNAQGQTLASNDDGGGIIDPRIDFTVPDGVKQLQVAVGDLARRGGEDFVYRVAATRLDRPRYEVSTDADAYGVPRGGSALITLTAKRQGYRGPIQLDFGRLPDGVTLSPTSIPAGRDRALVTLSADDVAPTRPTHWTAEVVAHSDNPEAVPDVAVMAGPDASLYERPWLANRVTLAVTKPDSLRIAVEGLDAAPKAKPGDKLTAKIKLVRAEGTKGAARLSLVTTQKVPQKKVKKDNKEVMVEDTERALRLEGKPTIAADASEQAVTILVPGDLPAGSYDFVVKAELLSADGKKVLSTAITPAFRLLIE